MKNKNKKQDASISIQCNQKSVEENLRGRWRKTKKWRTSLQKDHLSSLMEIKV